MNGRTTIDAVMNPCSADMDRHTYGWRWLNVSTWGTRWVRVYLMGLEVDVWWRGWKRPLIARFGNGAIIYWPLGSLRWATAARPNNKVSGPEPAAKGTP